MALGLALAISSGCQTTDKRLKQAAAAEGQARAAVILPSLPEPCRQAMGLVQPNEGEKWRAVQLRWEALRTNENAIKAACAGFYDDIRSRMAKGQ